MSNKNTARVISIEFGTDEKNKINRAKDLGISTEILENPREDAEKLLGENPLTIPTFDTRIQDKEL